MSLMIVHHRSEGKDYFIPWNNGQKQPFNSDARFFEIKELREWFEKYRPGDLGNLQKWVRICLTYNGVNNLSPATSASRILGRVRLPDGGALTPEIAFKMYGPKEKPKPAAKKQSKKAEESKPAPTNEPAAPASSEDESQKDEKKSGKTS